MKKTSGIRFLGAVLALGVLGSAGCFNRSHMTRNYGRAYRQAFERQVVNSSPAAKAPRGLDALEAGAVVQTYRTQLAPQGTSAPGSSQMILLSPNTGPLGSPTVSTAPAK